MAKKIKRKTKSEKPAAGKKTVRAKSYESHYLALALIGFLLLEGTLFSITTTADWQRGAAVLDMSGAISQTVTDVQTVFEPITTAASGVVQFYSLATDQMTQLLDLSGADTFSDITMVTSGVTEFYSQAATQMAQLLDVSSVSSWPASVAGASTSTY